MDTLAEKRGYERYCYPADIAFSYFNNEHSFNAHTLNIGAGGMCFKSNLFLQPGATIYIRLTKIHPNSSCSPFCEGLRSITLAEVKWCHEASGSGIFPFGVGVKYFVSDY